MTRRELERILTTWKRRLPLRAWKVEIDWSEPAHDKANASVWLPNDYHRAFILINPDFTSWEPEHATRIIVHELLHVLVRDLDAVRRHAGSLLGGRAEKLLHASWEHAEEGFVDQLATALAGLDIR